MLYKSDVQNELLYEFEIDSQDLLEEGSIEDGFIGEGGQKIALSVTSEPHANRLDGMNIRFSYSEPFTWKYVRKWRRVRIALPAKYLLMYTTAALVLAFFGLGTLLQYFSRGWSSSGDSDLVSSIPTDRPLPAQMTRNQSVQKDNESRSQNDSGEKPAVVMRDHSSRNQLLSSNVNGSKTLPGQPSMSRVRGRTNPETVTERGLIADEVKNLPPTPPLVSGNVPSGVSSDETALKPEVKRQVDELLRISASANKSLSGSHLGRSLAVGLNATKNISESNRISDLDNYVVKASANINFKVLSSNLSPEGKVALDQVATASIQLKSFVIEVKAFASAEGNVETNKTLAERRIQAVKDYFIEAHNVPLRRMSTSYQNREPSPLTGNATPEEREQARRIEVKLLVSRGINQTTDVKPINEEK